jgi:hypothetical protein
MQQMRTLAGPDASVAFTNLSRAASASLSAAFASSSPSAPSSTQQLAQAECHEQGVLALMQARGIAREQVCLLDPKSSEPLGPSDGDGNSNADSDDTEPDAGRSKFKWFLFGVRHLFASLSYLVSSFLSLGKGYTRSVYAHLPSQLCRKLNRTLMMTMMTVMLWVGDDPPRDRTAELRARGFPTRHLGTVQMTTDTAVGVTKRVVVDRGSSFLSFLLGASLT